MRILPFGRKELLTEPEKQRLVQAIRMAERLTSGEIRLYLESHCAYVDPMDRARELFVMLGMHKTRHANGVLLYIALKDHQYAILGDNGIHDKVGLDFWKKEAQLLLHYFSHNQVVEGIEACIKEIGTTLCEHFPYEDGNDHNELPDDIVLGK